MAEQKQLQIKHSDAFKKRMLERQETGDLGGFDDIDMMIAEAGLLFGWGAVADILDSNIDSEVYYRIILAARHIRQKENEVK